MIREVGVVDPLVGEGLIGVVLFEDGHPDAGGDQAVPAVLFLHVPLDEGHGLFRMLGLGEDDLRAAGADGDLVDHLRQTGDAIVQAFVTGGGKAGADVPCASGRHGDGAGQQGALHAVVLEACIVRHAVLNEGQVSDLLDGLDDLRVIDGAGGAVLGEPAAAVGQCPNLKLPGPVVNDAAVLLDVFLVEIRAQGVVAVGVEGQGLGQGDELVPGHSLGSGRIVQVGGIEHVLVVVQGQDFVRSGVSNGLAFALEGDGIKGHGVGALVHGGDVVQQAVGSKVQNAGLVHDAAVGKLTRGSHGVQLRDILFVGDCHDLNLDVRILFVELVGDGLHAGSLVRGAPIGVGDGDDVAVIAVGVIGGIGVLRGGGGVLRAVGLIVVVGVGCAGDHTNDHQEAQQERDDLLHGSGSFLHFKFFIIAASCCV